MSYLPICSKRHALALKQNSFLITGTAHCANMYEPKDSDFPQLKQAREKIREFLHVLLAKDVDDGGNQIH